MLDCVVDDIDVFVLLVYWTSRMRVVAKIQMEKWNGDVLDINETVQRLGPKKCSQLLCIHALSGCDTVSYPFGRGKKSALKLLETYQVSIKCSVSPFTDRRDVQQ